MPQPYMNARVAAYDVNPNETIDISDHTLEDDISIPGIAQVALQLTPPSGHSIKGVKPTAGWSSYEFTSSPITLTVAVPEPKLSNDVDFMIVIQDANGHCTPIDPKFTVKNTITIG